MANRFEVLGILGEGGASAVYRVADREHNNEERALKILLNNEAFDEHTLARFKDELRVCQQIRHPNIIEAYDLIALDKTIAFTMEYVPGSDLGRIFAQRQIQYEEIDKIFTQFLSALAELHKHNIVHRDIKLENVLIRNDGVVKLTDLGLIKHQDSKGLTRTGVLLGTAQYMPPEYIKAGKYDERGDIYATGVMLYEILTRKRRLHDKPGMQAIEHLLKTRFEIPKLPLEGLPRKYQTLIERSLDPSPRKRYQTPSEMLVDFTRDHSLSNVPSIEIRAGLQIHDFSSEPIRRKLQRRSKIIILLSIALFSAALVVAVAQYLGLNGSMKNENQGGQSVHDSAPQNAAEESPAKGH